MNSFSINLIPDAIQVGRARRKSRYNLIVDLIREVRHEWFEAQLENDCAMSLDGPDFRDELRRMRTNRMFKVRLDRLERLKKGATA